jgi:hypothetical protein
MIFVLRSTGAEGFNFDSANVGKKIISHKWLPESALLITALA